MKILSSILLVAAAANVGTALAPRGKTRRTVLFAVSLATLLALLYPLLFALSDPPALPDPVLFEYPESEAVAPDDLLSAAAKTALSREISRRFGATPREIGITLPENGGDPGKIRVVLAARDAGVRAKIEAWLKAESDADVAVTVEGENTE